MSNIILDDDTVIDMDLCHAAADEALEGLLDMHDTVENFDFATASFSMFVNCIQVLLGAGWTVEELKGEVVSHAAMAEMTELNEGSLQ